MNVQKITATVRYTQDTGHGAWKSLELGVEGTIDPDREDWRKAQATLYGQLAQQFKALWSQNGHAQETPQEAPEKPVQPSQAQSGPQGGAPAQSQPPANQGQPPEGQYCQIHGTAMKQQSNQRGSWWSHKTSDGKWCKG